MAVHERSESSTTRARQRVEDAVVVGAGAVALATALWLKQAGLAVTLVVDREPPAFDANEDVDLPKAILELQASAVAYQASLGAHENDRPTSSASSAERLVVSLSTAKARASPWR